MFEEKGELLTKKWKENNSMLEEIFHEILTSEDGDYVVQAQLLSEMKPAGW